MVWQIISPAISFCLLGNSIDTNIDWLHVLHFGYCMATNWLQWLQWEKRRYEYRMATCATLWPPYGITLVTMATVYDALVQILLQVILCVCYVTTRNGPSERVCVCNQIAIYCVFDRYFISLYCVSWCNLFSHFQKNCCESRLVVSPFEGRLGDLNMRETSDWFCTNFLQHPYTLLIS